MLGEIWRHFFLDDQWFSRDGWSSKIIDNVWKSLTFSFLENEILFYEIINFELKFSIKI
jgi:hypothetical protein